MDKDRGKIIYLTIFLGILIFLGLALFIRFSINLSDLFNTQDLTSFQISDEDREKLTSSRSKILGEGNKKEEGWNLKNLRSIDTISESFPYLLIKDGEFSIIYKLIKSDIVNPVHFIPNTATNVKIYDEKVISFIYKDANEVFLNMKDNDYSKKIKLTLESIDEVIDYIYIDNSFYFNIEADGDNYLYWLGLEDESLELLGSLEAFKMNFSFQGIDNKKIDFISNNKCFSYIFYNKRIEDSKCLSTGEEEKVLEYKEENYDIFASFKSNNRKYYLIWENDNLFLASKNNFNEEVIISEVEAPFRRVDEFFENNGTVYVIKGTELYYYDVLNFKWRQITFEGLDISTIDLINNKSVN